MTWVYFLTISIITFSVGQLLQKVLVKEEENDPATVAFVYQLTIAIIGFFVAFIHGFILPPIRELAGNFIVVGILYGMMNIFLFKALKFTEASDVAILLSTRSFWTIFAAIILLGEMFTPQKWLGAVIIFLAVILANQKNFSIKMGTGRLYALLAAVFFGFGSVSDAYLLRFSEPFSYTAINFALSAFFIALFQPKLITRIKTLSSAKTIATTLILGSVYYISVATFALGLTAGGKTSQMTPINQASIILTVILAAIFLGEKDRFLQKLFAAALVCIGVVLLM